VKQKNSGLKPFKEKISEQLQKAKSEIEDIEDRAKGKVAQAEIKAIKDLIRGKRSTKSSKPE
jgi:hypothetical protein